MDDKGPLVTQDERSACKLYLQDVSVTINNTPILNKITMPIYKNKVTAIIGASGCGKTTLLKTINDSLPADANVMGAIRVDDELSDCGDDMAISSKGRQLLTRKAKKVALIGQQPVVFPFSIYKNMTYALTYYGLTNSDEVQPVVEGALRKAGLYDEVKNQLDKPAQSLSGGQQQRLCIARQLAIEPEIILLDEPCSALDVKNTVKIEETLARLKSECTIVVVTHNIAQVKRLADYVAFMEEGQIVEFGETQDILEHPRDIRTREYLEYGV